MPVLSRFYGIIIRMYFLQSEHNPPHIHAIYNDDVAAIDFMTGEVLEGHLPDDYPDDSRQCGLHDYRLVHNREQRGHDLHFEEVLVVERSGYQFGNVVDLLPDRYHHRVGHRGDHFGVCILPAKSGVRRGNEWTLKLKKSQRSSGNPRIGFVWTLTEPL